MSILTRVALIVVYLVGTAAAVISLDANGENVEFLALVIWAVASVLLGWTTGQLRFALLALLAILFAVPFGYPDHYQYSEPMPIWWSAMFLAAASAVLIVLTALMKRVITIHRRRASS